MRGLDRLMANRLEDDIKAILLRLVDDIGFAEPAMVEDEGRSPFRLMQGVRSVIVHLTALSHVEELYGKHWWVARYPHIKRVNELIEEHLEEAGFKCHSISPYSFSPRTLKAPISFKLAGVKAGLGFWGKNHLLIHPRFGPRVVLGVMLTDAPLSSIKSEVKEDCGSCTRCIEACPLGIISPSGELDRWKCYHRNRFLTSPCRFVCMSECPIGKKI
jgi:epoxyqueuosine reductase QueG